LGTLRFVTPTPLRPADRRLLDDVAGHVAGLLHAHRLTHELQAARERLVRAREEERRRLRRDLHDGLGPALAGHLLRLELAARELPPGSPARQGLDALRDDVQTTVGDIRRLVEGLRPPALDEVGLAAAVTQIVERLSAGTVVACTVVIDPLPPLSAASEVAAYRIVSEAVTNVVRHAGATSCAVRIDVVADALRISIRDNGGGGAARARSGNGLETMRERAEELGGRLNLSDEEGTIVTAAIPVSEPSPALVVEATP
jgi:signal transduction histidine kinase